MVKSLELLVPRALLEYSDNMGRGWQLLDSRIRSQWCVEKFCAQLTTSVRFLEQPTQQPERHGHVDGALSAGPLRLGGVESTVCVFSSVVGADVV